jgi:hypothetical protein
MGWRLAGGQRPCRGGVVARPLSPARLLVCSFARSLVSRHAMPRLSNACLAVSSRVCAPEAERCDVWDVGQATWVPWVLAWRWDRPVRPLGQPVRPLATSADGRLSD